VICGKSRYQTDWIQEFYGSNAFQDFGNKDLAGVMHIRRVVP
jgi:hypothetical protein